MKLRAASATALALLLGACATPPPPAPLSAETAAAALTARSLDDVGLRRFLAENLGRATDSAWDFESLAWVAFYYHPSLAVARAQWDLARAAQQTAAARPNPTLSLVPGYNATRTPGVSPWFPSVNLDFLLPASGKRARQSDLARADAEAARLSVVTTAWRVRGELRRALADASFAARREPLLRRQAEAQRKILTLLEQRLSAGRIAAPELSAARSALVKAEAAATEARSQSATARVRAAAALGLPASALAGVLLPTPPLAPALSPAAFVDASRLSLHARTDILAALAHYESTQAALALEAAKQRPDFHLGPGYQWDQGASKWSLALTFELPLFHRNEGPIAEAVARRAEAAAQFASVQTQVLTGLDLAVAAQTSAAAQHEHAQKLRAEIQRQAALAQQRLDLGVADQLEVQSSRLDVLASDLLSLDAAIALALAAGQLEDALQIPFPHLSALADPTARATASRTP